MATIGELPSDRIDIGRVVSRGFETLRRQIGPFLALSMLLAALPILIMQYLVGDSADPTPLGLTWLVTMITGYLLQAALVRSSILDQNDRPVDMRESIAVAFRLLLPMIGLMILSWIMIGIGLVLLIVPGLIVYSVLIVSVPALVEERRGVIESMNRSRELTSGSRPRILLLVVLFFIFYAALEMIVPVLTGVLGSDTAITRALGAALISAVTAMFVAVMLASLYIELRTVKEGATTDSLASIFE